VATLYTRSRVLYVTDDTVTDDMPSS